MASPGDIFAACQLYRDDPEAISQRPHCANSCATCRLNYGDRVCAIFQSRLLRALGLEDVQSPKKEVTP